LSYTGFPPFQIGAQLIDFDTDGEEWARNLPTAYRNGAVYVYAEEVLELAASMPVRRRRAPALASQRARQPD
jgi:hypothetical protein